jgi:sialic acid synthase SpsE
MKGPDHIFSLEPEGMRELSALSRKTFFALGDGRKRVMPSEMETLRSLRRSIFAAQDIPAGAVLSRDMLTVKSPGTGILPKYLDLLIGRVVRGQVREDFPITWDLI